MSKAPVGPRPDLSKLLKDFASSRRAEDIRARGRGFEMPDDEELAAYLRGEWPEERARQLRAAILVDPACARRVARLAGGGLPEGQQDLFPDPLVLLYFAEAVPTGPLGDHLRDEIAARFAGSAAADRLLDVVQWSKAEPDEERRAWLHWLLTRAAEGQTGIVVTTGGRGLGRAARMGAARAGDERVGAWLVDADDKLMLDGEGRPVQVAFTVLNARLDAGRGLFVQLLTDDERLLGAADPAPLVHLSLRHESHFLRFPPVELRPGDRATPYPSGTATIRASLGVDMDVARLPGDALVVTVRMAAPGGETR